MVEWCEGFPSTSVIEPEELALLDYTHITYERSGRDQNACGTRVIFSVIDRYIYRYVTFFRFA